MKTLPSSTARIAVLGAIARYDDVLDNQAALQFLEGLSDPTHRGAVADPLFRSQLWSPHAFQPPDLATAAGLLDEIRDPADRNALREP